MVTPPRKPRFRPDLVDMDPLVVAGRLGKEIDALLGDINPFTNPELGAYRGLEFIEVAEDAHVPSSCPYPVKSPFPERWPV
jgi:hypothetical protein